MIIHYEKPELPVIVPKPQFVQDCKTPVIDLGGAWQYSLCESDQVGTDDAKIVANECDSYNWQEVLIPNDMTRVKQLAGQNIRSSYWLKKQIKIPDEWYGKTVFLRFSALNGLAQVWLNGRLAGKHENGFITWTLNITEYVSAGEEICLAIYINESDRVSTFNHGGLLQTVELVALPLSYVTRLHCETKFDQNYLDAELRVRFAIEVEPGKSLSACFRLLDDDGTSTELGKREWTECGEEILFPVSGPDKWDSEHPNLYTLVVDLYEQKDNKDILLESVSRRFGFRQIEIVGNQMFVNGDEIKLRGVCRHEITALTGRSVPADITKQDVLLFKQANINYIRTSHYPPSELFLDLCDEYGIYVEDELALAFIARSEDYTQRDPAYAQRYLSHFTEVLERDRSHPSVIIWSIANESFGGHNFNRINQFMHEEDSGRPTKFSYPMTMQAEHEDVDIWSIHYANIDSDLSAQKDNVSVGFNPHSPRPVLHDEYAHVPCYNRNEHKRDPYVRHFWGESLARFWDKIWNTQGALGGAIWAGIDETDIFTGGQTALEWGIIDIWRRPKPEYYMTKQAYSPIKILSSRLSPDEVFNSIDKGQSKHLVLTCEIENRFNHTNMREIEISWQYGSINGLIDPIDLAPRCSGSIRAIIPVGEVKTMSAAAPQAGGLTTEGSTTGGSTAEISTTVGSTAVEVTDSTMQAKSENDSVRLIFTDAAGMVVNEFVISIVEVDGQNENYECESTQGQEISSRVISENASGIYPKISEGEHEISVEVGAFAIAFSKETGLIKHADWANEIIIVGGPILNVPYLQLPDWRCTSINAEMSELGDDVRVTISGSYGDALDVCFVLYIDGNANVRTEYTIEKVKIRMPRAIKTRVGVDRGGLDELGVAYLLDGKFDYIKWKRRGFWTTYPEDHIGRTVGSCRKNSSYRQPAFAEKPDLPWSEEMCSYVLYGRYDVPMRGSNDFRSTKENVYHYRIGKSSELRAVGVKGSVYENKVNTLTKELADNLPEASLVSGPSICVVSDGEVSVRAELVLSKNSMIDDRDERIKYRGIWYKMCDKDGSYKQTEMWSNQVGSSAEVIFNGTGIVWLGSTDVICGRAAVYIDDEIVDANVEQRVNGVEYPGAANGYDKRYNIPVFSITNLPVGVHKIRIEVTGEKASDAADCYINIDAFYVLKSSCDVGVIGSSDHCVRLNINNKFAYPNLAWGNYMREKITIYDGYKDSVTFRLEGM